MNDCLGDRALFRLSEGDGTEWERLHLATCPGCRTRYRRFVSAVEVAGQVLRDGPWPDGGASRSVAIRWGFIPAAALAAVLALAWFGVVGRGSRLSTPTGEPGAAYAALSLTDVSSTLFADDGVWRSDEDADEEALQAALQGEWPCDGVDRLLNTACD
jgi:hypothetical protein